MAPKQTLDKHAWQWAEQTNPNEVTLENIRTAYRSILQPCPAVPGFCRKNCKGSPNCYNCLGEKAWIEKNLDEELKEALNESSGGGKRTPGTFIGLKNLGATCYANTFLQVWFHNPGFRRGILEWSDDGRGQLNSLGDGLSENSLSPTNVVDQLQLIFALLSFSDRQYIDPSSFIECLQLDTSLQQDAQEFSKLFISLLEDQLPVKYCYHGLNLVQHQFVGRYEYVTRCNGCGQQSHSGSKFYEIDLNIKGHSNLDECLKEFLQEEKLDGENQYHCQYCMTKQDAVRRIHLLELPPTLNFQLLRFVFDRQTQNKKKLTSYLQFPQILDMNEYMSDSVNRNKADMMYDLVSVLIHRGPGAHSGHYVAVIKDCTTQATYRFNDEEVEKLSEDRFRLEAEEDADGSKSSQKKPRAAKGCLISRNAYMLVYRRRNSEMGVGCPEMTLQSLSPRLQVLVEMDNQKHELSLREQFETRKFYISKERERQEMVKHFYDIIQKAQDEVRDDSYEWISTSWLRAWLAADCMGTVPPIDNMALLCPHEKVHPDNVALAKLLPRPAADMIFEKFGGCMRLPCFSSMCRQCVEEKCRVIRTKVMLTEDNKMIGHMLKIKDPQLECETSYWVGKQSLKNWRQMAEKILELSSASQKEGREHENEPENGAKDLAPDDSLKQNHVRFSPSCTSTSANLGDSGDAVGTGSTDAAIATAAADADIEEEENWSFNEDLLCCAHGNLSTDITTRRLVPQNIWLLLKKYFPRAPEFGFQSPVCYRCKTQDEQEKLFKEQDKAAALEQRQKLAELYSDKRRPCWSLPEAVQLNIVSCQFLEEWKKFIRDPAKQPVASIVDNASLLCNHGRFMYDVERSEALNEKYVYIWPVEWMNLMTYIKADVEITVRKSLDASGQRLLTSPEFCEKCCHERQQVEYSSQFTYTNEVIYVRKVTEETRSLFASSLNSSKSPTTTTTVSDGEGVTDDVDDPDVTNENGKRKHNSDSAAEKVQRLDMPSSLAPIRRSARKGRVQDEIKFDVSSTQTLRDLKMQLVKAFSVMKLDQHLYLDGVELSDESATLEQLRIRPGSILYLQADEPSSETTFMDVSPVNSVEEGFKGTSLVGR